MCGFQTRESGRHGREIGSGRGDGARRAPPLLCFASSTATGALFFPNTPHLAPSMPLAAAIYSAVPLPRAPLTPFTVSQAPQRQTAAVLSQLMESLQSRLLSSVLEDFGLDAARDFSPSTPSGRLSLASAGCLLGCLEVAMEGSLRRALTSPSSSTITSEEQLAEAGRQDTPTAPPSTSLLPLVPIYLLSVFASPSLPSLPSVLNLTFAVWLLVRRSERRGKEGMDRPRVPEQCSFLYLREYRCTRQRSSPFKPPVIR